MAIKDYEMSENMDHKNQQESAREQQARPDGAANAAGSEQGGGKTEVKNAHASGDGSFGRNESSIPENHDEEKGRDSVY